jgi:hypothetical protein
MFSFGMFFPTKWENRLEEQVLPGDWGRGGGKGESGRKRM